MLTLCLLGDRKGILTIKPKPHIRKDSLHKQRKKFYRLNVLPVMQSTMSNHSRKLKCTTTQLATLFL